MGAARSKFSTMFTSTFRGEARMLKEVSKEKPAQAPRHPSTEEAFKKLLKGIVSKSDQRWSGTCSQGTLTYQKGNYVS